jgi:hypothetical protein
VRKNAMAAKIFGGKGRLPIRIKDEFKGLRGDY